MEALLPKRPRASTVANASASEALDEHCAGLLKVQLLARLDASMTGNLCSSNYSTAELQQAPFGAAAQAEELSAALGRSLRGGHGGMVLLSGFRGCGKGATLNLVLQRFQSQARTERRAALATNHAEIRETEALRTQAPVHSEGSSASDASDNNNTTSEQIDEEPLLPFRVVRLHGLLHQKPGGNSAAYTLRHLADQLSGRTARGSSGLSGADSFSASLNFVKTAVRALVEAPDDHNSDDEENEDGDDHDGSTSESSESEDSDSDNGDKACGAVQKPASSSDSMVASRPKRCCLVLVLEHFEAFAEEGRQTLLYSLLDLRHEKGLHLIVVAVTSHQRVLDLLEKRVRSRCGNVIPVHFCHPTPVVAGQALRAALTIPNAELARPVDNTSAGLPSGGAVSSATPNSYKRSSSSLGSSGPGNRKRRWGPSSSSPLVDDDVSSPKDPLSSQGKNTSTTLAHPASTSQSLNDELNTPVALRLFQWQMAWNKAWARVSASEEWESVVRRHVELGRSPSALVALASCAIDNIGSAGTKSTAESTSSSSSCEPTANAAEKQNTGALSSEVGSNSHGSSSNGRPSSSSGSSGGGTGISAMMPGVSAWVEAAHRMSPSLPLQRLLSGLGAAESTLLLSCFRLERRLSLAAAAAAKDTNEIDDDGYDMGGGNDHGVGMTAAEKRLAAGYSFEAVMAEYHTLFATGVTGMAARRYLPAHLQHAFRSLLRGGHVIPTQPFKQVSSNSSSRGSGSGRGGSVVSVECAQSLASVRGVRLTPAIDLAALEDLIKRHSSGHVPSSSSSSSSSSSASSSSGSSSSSGGGSGAKDDGPFQGCGIELLRWCLRTAETA